MSNTTGLKRRSFLKWSGAVAGASALTGTALSFAGSPGVGPKDAAVAADGMADADKTVWSACLVNCGSRCPLRMQVKDGVIARVLQDNTGSDELNDQQLRACVRGRSARRRIYNPNRLQKPLLRREGTKRGDGIWDEIEWDQALDIFADEWKRINTDFGPSAMHFLYWSGVEGGNFTNSGGFQRLLNCTGGSLGFYGTYSVACMVDSIPAHYGSMSWDNSFNDVAYSKLLVLWGDNSLETRMSGGGWTYILQQIKKNTNLKIIVIDPRYSDTAACLADEWIPIRPGTDAALVAGMVHTMLAENLHDQEFIDKYCMGFDETQMPTGVPANSSYKSYVMGLGPDGVEKTPEWAAKLTGIPADKIRRFAREVASAKPCAIRQGWGIQRQANGETACRAPMLIANVTGNVGLVGGGIGAHAGNFGLPVQWFDDYKSNPIEQLFPTFLWTDVIKDGKNMTAEEHGIRNADKLDNDIKMIICYASNTLMNQHADTNQTRELLRDESKCEFIVGIDNHMTPSMEMCDLVLPETSWFEREDFIGGIRGGDMAFAIYLSPVVDPLFECRDGWDMCVELSKRLGVEQEFTEGRTKQEWVAKVYEDSRVAFAEKGLPPLPSQEEMKLQGVYRASRPKGAGIAFKDFIDDPVANPLETPSGKIEIFSQKFYEAAKTMILPEGDRLPALPEQVETFEGYEKVTADSKYPLQCLGHHTKAHVHSTYVKVDWLEEANNQRVWINTMDAKERGIGPDDQVYVFNDRGRIKQPVYVTPRIAPGVISVPQGAWVETDENGVDVGGNVNTLTSWHPTPFSKGTAQHTTLVQVEKA